MITRNGILIVASTTPDATPRPRKLIPATPYATTALLSVIPVTLNNAMINVFRR